MVADQGRLVPDELRELARGHYPSILMPSRRAVL